MAGTRAKTIALLTAAAAVIVLAAGAFSARNPLLERYYLWRLASGTEAERADAAESLGKIGGARAIRPLLGAIRQLNWGGWGGGGSGALRVWELPTGSAGKTTFPGFPGRARWFVPSSERLPPGAEVFADPIGKILRRSPLGAWTIIESELEYEDAPARRIAVLVLCRLTGKVEQALPLIRRAADDPDEEVRTAAIHALLTSETPGSMDAVLLRMKLRPTSPGLHCGTVQWSCSCDQCMPSRASIAPGTPGAAPRLWLKPLPPDPGGGWFAPPVAPPRR